MDRDTNKHVIIIENLYKKFFIQQRESGLVGSLKSLIWPKYNEVIAVDNISFIVNKGEMLAFIGPNGAGKSTTIKMLSGILTPTSGTIKIAGLNPGIDRIKLAYKIGSVFGQKSQLWYHVPPIDTYYLLYRLYELNYNDYKQRLDFLVKEFDIESLLKIPVRKLSLGQRMRCEIVASLLHKPEILFLDEPTIGLDIVAKQQLRETLKSLNKKEGLTLLLTSHDTADIEAIAQRTIIINNGKIIYNNDTSKLKSEYIKTKIIEIITQETTSNFSFNQGKIIEKKEHSIKIEIDTNIASIESLLNYALDNFTVLDITIIETPLEDIISHIYHEQNS